MDAFRDKPFLLDWLIVSEIDDESDIRPNSSELRERVNGNFQSITCNFCQSIGKMCATDNSWPSERDPCPNCGEAAISLVYVSDG